MKQLRPWQAPIFQIFPLLLICLALSWLSPTLSETYQRFKDCARINYTCGDLTVPVAYPFRVDGRHDYCGYKDYFLICSNNRTLTINIGDRLYQVKDIDYMNHMIKIADPSSINGTCPLPHGSTTLDLTLYEYSERDLNLTFFFNCIPPLASNSVLYDVGCNSSITDHRSYYLIDGHDDPLDLPRMCSSTMIVSVDQAAISMLESNTSSFRDVLLGGFSAKWIAGKGWCSNCSLSGGLCGYNADSPNDQTCICSYGLEIGTCSSGTKGARNIIIGVATGGAGFLGLCCWLFLFLYRRRKRQQKSSSSLLFRSPSFGQSPNKDPELGSTIYQIQNFTYKELQEATDGFDDSKELGDGGFGTVYKGKLRDGRTVAVKRLYENNYRRVEQFMNEIVILSRLRHQNLVTLYGCSSRHSRELVLVYEFVPNGTVADHLHGSRATEGALTWPIRMNIAIETADALAYLHAIEPQIIHRDVKTNNILLDNGFHVKVADFGLSRLFPLDATHVSTAPQGTPGYVDPEYHQCYQLTDKSDVYSFGVVLIELISSKPAVDISRHRHEINLASMAVHKIQNRELDQLVDPELGYESDSEVKSMITQVAELAFRCLQADGDMRPPIKEALEVLQGIQSRWKKAEKATDSDANTRNGTPLLKTAVPYSPDSVTDQWASRSTTSNASN